MFDPERYTISIRKEEDDGTTYHFGRVAELPDVLCIADTWQEAYLFAIEVIQDLKEMNDEMGHSFPEPINETSA